MLVDQRIGTETLENPKIKSLKVGTELALKRHRHRRRDLGFTVLSPVLREPFAELVRSTQEV
jgi:hypothetical protein